jgi:hypothetical protein
MTAVEIIHGTIQVTPGSGSHDFTMPPGFHPASIVLEPVSPADTGTATFPSRDGVNSDPWTQVVSLHVEWNCVAAAPVNYNFWITAFDTATSISHGAYGGS